ncbi:hypothetical protein KAR28_03805 [Candidatus Parcubacteria bacterium]|nr:hypothetical protein [Candidatus Parcubacteria bacterium]
MSKLRKITNKEAEKYIPKEELKYAQKLGTYKLENTKRFSERDDSLINIEIAFRKCKRVGVFD